MNAPSTQRLPDAWVESLLARMLAIYGNRFQAQWADVPPASMRESWAATLGRFTGEQIKWALEQMVDSCPWPPTLPEFVALCRQAPRPEPEPEPVNGLPAPDAVVDSIQRVQKVAETAPKRTKAFEYAAPSTDWAFKLRKRFLAGESLYLSQIQAGSKVCGENWIGEGRARRCVPIDEANAA